MKTTNYTPGGRNKKPESWWVNQKGYIEGRVWVGGIQRRVKRHRWIMETHLGRSLLATEDVHHKDGNKQNNALSNLELLRHGSHTAITNAQRPSTRGYKLNLSAAARMTISNRAKRIGLAEIGRSVIAISKATTTPQPERAERV